MIDYSEFKQGDLVLIIAYNAMLGVFVKASNKSIRFIYLHEKNSTNWLKKSKTNYNERINIANSYYQRCFYASTKNLNENQKKLLISYRKYLKTFEKNRKKTYKELKEELNNQQNGNNWN